MPNSALQATAKTGPRLSAQVVRPTGQRGVSEVGLGSPSRVWLTARGVSRYATQRHSMPGLCGLRLSGSRGRA